MSGVRTMPLMRAANGVPVPWWDSRLVPLSTLLEYLGCDQAGFAAYLREGAFAHPGCTQLRGERRPIQHYRPCAIWAANPGWTPPEATLRVLALSDAALEREIAAARAYLTSLRPPLPSRGGAPLRVVEPLAVEA